MDTLKPYQKIASKYQISEESAKYFLGRVQKSFKQDKPPHALILEFMNEREFDSLPEPYTIALLMHENGIWDRGLNSPPPVLVDDEE